MNYSRGVVIRSFLWKLLEKFSVQGLSLFLTLVLARILDPQDYGLIALIAVFTSLSAVIIDGGLNIALVQKKDADQVDFSTVFFSSILLSIILYVILFLLAPNIAAFYDNNALTNVVRVFSIVIIFEAANAVQRAYVAKNMLFKKLFYSSISALVLSGTVGMYMAIKGYGVWALVSLNICSTVVTTVVMFYTIRWYPSFTFSFIRFKTLFNYGWKIFSINVIVSFYTNIRSLIIGKFYSPASLAFFEKGKSLSEMAVSNVSSSIQIVIFPVFSDAQYDIDRVKQLVRRSISLSSFFMFPILALLCVIAKPLVLLVLTEKWLPAVPFIWIFSLAYMILIVQSSSMEAVKALGHSDFSLKYEIVKHIIETIILICTVFWGVYAIAIGTIIYNFISLILNIYPNLVFLKYNIREQISDYKTSLLFTLLMGLSVYWIQNLPMPLIFVIMLQLSLGGLVYLFLCHVFKQSDYLYVKALILSKIKPE